MMAFFVKMHIESVEHNTLLTSTSLKLVPTVRDEQTRKQEKQSTNIRYEENTAFFRAGLLQSRPSSEPAFFMFLIFFMTMYHNNYA